MKKTLVLSSLLVVSLLAGCTANSTNTAQSNVDVVDTLDTVRVGYFPNITHAQPLVGVADGTFQTELGDTKIETYTFNAGPAEIEALFAGQIDIAYIGPSPALNGYVQSEGSALKIVSGSMSGGAAFVVQPDLAAAFRANGASALTGKTFASPQQGNTQDVSLRNYLQEQGVLEQVTISPMANADQISLFQQKQLDGSWLPEPWASRLVAEAGGEILIDERDLWPDGNFATTVVIVRTDFLNEHPTIVKKWLTAHIAVTTWINDHPTEAQGLVNDEIERLTGSKLDTTVLANAWERLDPSYAPDQASIDTFREHAESLGFLDGNGLDFTGIYDFSLLSQVTGQQYQ